MSNLEQIAHKLVADLIASPDGQSQANVGVVDLFALEKEIDVSASRHPHLMYSIHHVATGPRNRTIFLLQEKREEVRHCMSTDITNCTARTQPQCH